MENLQNRMSRFFLSSIHKSGQDHACLALLNKYILFRKFK